MSMLFAGPVDSVCVEALINSEWTIAIQQITSYITLKLALEGEGFDVDTFDNPKLALSSFRPNYYDLLLLDIKMPGMNGFEFYREIKKIDGTIKL